MMSCKACSCSTWFMRLGFFYLYLTTVGWCLLDGGNAQKHFSALLKSKNGQNDLQNLKFIPQTAAQLGDAFEQVVTGGKSISLKNDHQQNAQLPLSQQLIRNEPLVHPGQLDPYPIIQGGFNQGTHQTVVGHQNHKETAPQEGLGHGEMEVDKQNVQGQLDLDREKALYGLDHLNQNNLQEVGLLPENKVMNVNKQFEEDIHMVGNQNGLREKIPLDKDNNYDEKFNDDQRSKKARKTPKGPTDDLRKDINWFPEKNSFNIGGPNNGVDLGIKSSPIPKSGTPWPHPAYYRSYTNRYYINPATFKFVVKKHNCDVLRFSFGRIRSNIFVDYLKDLEAGMPKNGNRYIDQDVNKKWISSLSVSVLEPCTQYPSLEMNEKYDLIISKMESSLVAQEVWGALRGLETFSQLVYRSSEGLYAVNKTSIQDYPRFAHRGMLLDTSRHYLKVETILKNLEAMAQNKLNVFHWHMVDDNSFPFQSKTFPNLTLKGAYDPVNAIYSHKTILEIIEQARLRGIRVIPEFDTPGHTLSWGYGQDNLLTPCYNYQGELSNFFGPLNPILKTTYVFLEKLFTEVMSLFPDDYIHLGGDEVPFECWYNNPHVSNFMQRHDLGDVKDLLNIYGRKLLDIISGISSKLGKKGGKIVWQEVFDNGVKLNPDSIVQIWMGDRYDINRITGSGLRVLFSSCWYLDYISYGQDWEKYYQCTNMEGYPGGEDKEPDSELLLGGEICMWTEFAADEVILPRIWPRASAAAERLWSPSHVDDFIQAAPRIEEQRCRMIRQGIPVGVLGGPGYCPSFPRFQPLNSSKTSNASGMSPTTFYWLDKLHYPEKMLQTHDNNPSDFVVDIHATYLIPAIIVGILAVLLLVVGLLNLREPHRLISIIRLPVGSIAGRKRSLLYVFVSFIVVWCLWTAPLWTFTADKQVQHGPR